MYLYGDYAYTLWAHGPLGLGCVLRFPGFFRCMLSHTALRTHTLRLLGPTTVPCQALGLLEASGFRFVIEGLAVRQL